MKKRYKLKRNNEDSQSSQIQSDLTLLLACSFIACAVILLLLINPVAITQVPEREPLEVTVTWDTCLNDGDRTPGMSRSDVDLWMLGEFANSSGEEIRNIIGYSTPDRKTEYFILDQDDKGYSAYTASKEAAEDQLNREVIKSAKQTLSDGYYHVNLHLFSDKLELTKVNKICVDVQVVLYKGVKGKENIVCDLKSETNTAAELTSKAQELTVCQFEVRNGELVTGSEQNIVQNPFLQESRRTRNFRN